MGEITGIEWTDSTWSPVKGCTRVSPGCVNCYAETLAGRFCGRNLPMHGFATRTPSGPRWTGRVELVPERLPIAWRWKRPRMIFVNSQSDTFHESLSNTEIAAVFGAMALAPQHTFQVLTKRSARMREWIAWAASRPECLGEGLWDAGYRDSADDGLNPLEGVALTFPLPNVWMGVSVENQDYESRIEDLLRTPAAVRFLSCEPLLGPLDLWPWFSLRDEHGEDLSPRCPRCNKDGASISWVIVGGESGRQARPMHPQWARSIRDQCAEAGVPFFFKQWGEWQAGSAGFENRDHERIMLNDGRLLRCLEELSPAERYAKTFGPAGLDANVMTRVGKKAAGALLDGVEHRAVPS